jgi:ribosome-associated translation inhibitor RaiA
MPVPIQVTFHGVPLSPWVEKLIQRKVAKLERFGEVVVGCHVIVEAPHHHRRKGNAWGVHVDVTYAGGEIASSHGHDDDRPHDDLHAAIVDAFAVAERRLAHKLDRRRTTRTRTRGAKLD